MAGLGWSNPAALSVGGGAAKTESVYRALRSLVGVGGAGPVDSLEDTWRQVKASAIASVVVETERAALQSFPHVTTDYIAAYERMLGLVPGAGASDEERRRAIVAAWTAVLTASCGSIQDGLQAIDPRLSLSSIPYSETTIVMLGRMFFSQEDPGNPIEFPNYADDFIVRVMWDVSGGAVMPPPDVRDAADRLLNTVLPAWVDYQVVTETSDGFCCDGGVDGTSLLDLKTLGH